jgi:hypothetical protein
VSRAIHIRVSESVVRTIHVEDGVQSPLEMLPVLPPERMGDLLASELVERGFVREGNVMRRLDADGIEVTVDLVGSSVTVRIAHGETHEETVSLAANVENRETGEERLRERAGKALEAAIAARTEELQREVTQRLERKLADLAAELDGAIGKATVAALTERAKQLGEIKELVADEAGNVTIKVKL